MSKSRSMDEQCPMDLSINILSGKWKISILWHLSKGIVRFNELQKILPNISQKILTQQLRELEQAGVIIRKVYAEVPPKVEYSLSQLGESLKPILSAMCQWGKEYKKYIRPPEKTGKV